MTDPKDLLAVLDLPEEERPKRLYELGYLREYIKLSKMSGGTVSYAITAHSAEDAQFYTWNISLADLAFSLRDESKWLRTENGAALYFGLKKVCCKILDYEEANTLDANLFGWLIYNAQPIHWIIAALIAKEKK